MQNDNETVEQVCEKIASVAKEMHETDYGEVWSMAYEIERCNEAVLAAHQHEMNDLARKKTDEAHDAFVRNAELANAIVEKDEEIASLRALVKAMADIVDAPLCHQDCSKCPPDTRCASKRIRALVAKAREVCK